MNAHGAASALSMTASSSSSSASSAVSKVAASLSSSSTSSTGNWRGKYLRALNISAPEVDVSRKTPRSASGSCSSATSTSSAATQQQLRRARSYRVDANRSVTFSRSFHTATEREGDEFQARVNRYQVSHLARTSSRRQLQSGGPGGSNSRSAYGFAVKPDLARGRRCHTDPVVSDDKVSAPIEIPSGAAGTVLSTGATLSDIVGDNNSDSRYSSRSPLARHSSRSSNNNNASHYRLDATAGKLLSWEEPSVMLALEPQQLGGLDMAFSNLHLDRRSSSRSGATGTSGDDLFYCDEFVDTDDEEDDDEDDDEGAAVMSSDDDDPIFAMEDFDSDPSRESSRGDNNNDSGLARKSSSSRDKSRRRLRTAASASMLVAPPPSGRTAALSRFHSVRQLRCGSGSSSSSHGLELPASFVPPHEMIQRDCFSIGLRDEFKRRQAKI